MKIVLLGASGQIGSLLYHALKPGHHVVGTSRGPLTGLMQFDPLQDDWSALGKAEILINAVGQIDASDTHSFHRVHAGLTERILQNRERIGTPFIIQISALGASPLHKTDFLRTKGVADDLLLSQFGTAIIRPSIVCTHRTMLVRKMLMLERISRYTGGVIPVPDGFLQTRLQPVMPEDLTDLVHAVCEKQPNGIVNVAGAEVFAFRDIIRIMEQTRNRRFTFMNFPRAIGDVVVGQFVSRLWPKVIGYEQYQLLFEDNIADITRAEGILGRPMRTTRAFFEMELSHANN